MKYVPLLFTALLVFVAQPAGAQGIFDAVMKAAELENERRGWSDNSTMSAEEKAAWEEKWRQKIDGSAEMLAAFDPDGSCVAMMVLYVYDYKNLIATTNREQDCQRKYDLYGMQLLSMASSANILYCPEGLSKLAAAELQQVEEEYWQVLRSRQPAGSNVVADLVVGTDDSDQDSPTDPWEDLMRKSVTLGYPGLVDRLIGYFTPAYLGTQTLSVASKMEALPCAP